MTDANHPNADQADFWNGPGGETWTTQRDRFNAMLGSIGDEAIARAAISRGAPDSALQSRNELRNP